VHRCTRTLLLAGVEAAVNLEKQLDDEMEQHKRRRSIVLARWRQHSLVTKHVVHYTRTLLLASVEAAVNLKQQLDNQMEQIKRCDYPRRPRRHKRLVQVQADEDRRHCKHGATSHFRQGNINAVRGGSVAEQLAR